MAKTSSNNGGYYIFRAWRTDKYGNRIYAKTYGKRAFKIWISNTKKEA